MFVHIIVLFACLLGFGVASANESLYEVRENDVLSTIAQRFPGVTWKDIWDANRKQVKNPHRIYPKQQLRIPAPKQKQAAQESRAKQDHQVVDRAAKKPLPATEKPTHEPPSASELAEGAPTHYWRNPGQNPCQEPAENVIHKLEYPEHIAKELVKKVQEKDYTIDHIKPGDRFDAMCFGKGKISKNVVASWNPDTILPIPAKVYAFEHAGVLWELVCPDWTCKNCSKRTRPIPSPPPPIPVPKQSEPPSEAPLASPVPAPEQPVVKKPKEPCDCPELVTIAIFEPISGDTRTYRGWWNESRDRNSSSPFPNPSPLSGD